MMLLTLILCWRGKVKVVAKRHVPMDDTIAEPWQKGRTGASFELQFWCCSSPSEYGSGVANNWQRVFHMLTSKLKLTSGALLLS